MRVAHSLLGAWALLAAAQGMAAQPAAVLKLEPYRKSVAMRVDVHGHKGLFTLDTAGGITLVSPDFAKAAGCKPWGQIIGFRMGGEKLSSQRCDNFAFSVSGHSL